VADLPLNPSLRVALDVTPLGRGRFYPRGRTGLFRVAAELSLALSEALGERLQLVAVECRGEAEESLHEAGFVRARVLRSGFDRALFPLIRKLTVPADFQPSRGLSERRRKIFRTLVNGIEWMGGAPQSVRRSVDLCHSVFLPISQLRMGEVPSVVTVHDLLPLVEPQFFGESDRINLRRVVEDIKRGAYAHCVSQATERALLKFAPETAARTFVAPLAANPRRFYPATEDMISQFRLALGLGKSPYFLTVGTLDPRKNLQTVLAAFAEVAQHQPDARLVLVGAKARGHDPLTPVIERHRIGDKCLLTGFLPDEMLRAAYHGALAFLFPSHGEGFGLPILEAMSCKGVVIASNNTSIPEVVGSAGVLLPATDVAAWAQAMTSLAVDSETRLSLAERGYRRAQTFSWTRTAETLVSRYQEVIKKSERVRA